MKYITIFFCPINYQIMRILVKFFLSFIVLLSISCCSKAIVIPDPTHFKQSNIYEWSFTGKYDATWGRLQLKQDGNIITGQDSLHTITGYVKGNRMDGTWYAVGTNGPVYFIISDDGMYLKGAYGGRGGEIVESNVWHAKRIGVPNRKTTSTINSNVHSDYSITKNAYSPNAIHQKKS